MPERPRFPEFAQSSLSQATERGSQRWKRVLLGITTGAVLLPLVTLGLASIDGGVLSNVPQSEIPGVVRAIVGIQGVIGGFIGGVAASRMGSRPKP